MNSLLFEMLITQNLSQDGQGYIPTYILHINIWRKKTINSKIGWSPEFELQPRMDWSIGVLFECGGDLMPMHGGVRLTDKNIKLAFFCISLSGFGQVMAMMAMMVATCPRVDWSKDPLRTGTRGNMSMAMQKKAPNT